MFVLMLLLQEGQALLDGEELEKTRAQTASAKSPVTSPGSKIKRTTTIAQTTQVIKDKRAFFGSTQFLYNFSS